jgi:hypothetical protein
MKCTRIHLNAGYYEGSIAVYGYSRKPNNSWDSLPTLIVQFTSSSTADAYKELLTTMFDKIYPRAPRSHPKQSLFDIL